MRSGRWLHAAMCGAVVVAASRLAGVAAPAPARARPPSQTAAGSGAASAGGSGAAPRAPGAPAATDAPRPAGSSAIESTDVPPWTAPPARFAVVPFENRANVRAFDWLVAGAPFEVSEKTEGVLGLESTGGPLHVGGEAIEAEPGAIAAFAASRGATFVITGWVERPAWQLRIDLALWKIVGPSAALAAEAQRTGEVKAYHQLLGEALGEVWSKGAGIAIDDAHARALQRALAGDLYAVTLLGRGLGHLTGALPPATPPPVHPAGSAGSGSAAGPASQVDLKAAEHDLERAVFIDPRCFEAQR
ncbi:MAG TPA: hypothetical protein VFT22_05860, partial [Kofleriaceae bacterium]|nr:hypothetical protein [Kofleriaceae bacterium]